LKVQRIIYPFRVDVTLIPYLKPSKIDFFSVETNFDKR
jgi:hypothetical protein